MRSIKYITLIASMMLVFSCKDKEEEKKDDFSKTDLMQNISNQWIEPCLSDLSARINSLDSSFLVFESNPNLLTFSAVQDNWKAAYLSFQRVKFIDFGPGMNIGFQGAMGTFPSDTTIIESNINAGSYDLNTFSNIAACGFSSLDYLLFRANAFTDLSSSQSRKDYVKAVIAKLKTEANYMQTNWQTYEQTFINGVGTSSTDAFSQLVNAFCKDFELCKNAKIGIPIGKQSLGIMRPEYLEARYSKFGKELILENMIALKSVFLGNSINGTSGKGFDDYLIALEKQSLSTTIETRFNELIARPSTWNDMENMMNTDFSTIDSYFTYISGSVVYLKTDMTSAFGILITYQDNDGD